VHPSCPTLQGHDSAEVLFFVSYLSGYLLDGIKRCASRGSVLGRAHFRLVEAASHQEPKGRTPATQLYFSIFCELRHFLVLANAGRDDISEQVQITWTAASEKQNSKPLSYLLASHHIVGASTVRMTIGIQMNHAAPAYSPLTTL